MIKKKKILKLLYRSFDDRLKEKEEKILEKALIDSPELQQEKEQIEIQRKIAASSSIQSFKPYFADRVMARINALEGKPNGLDLQIFYESLVSVFRKVAIIGAAASIAMFIYSLGIEESLSLHDALTMSDLTVRQIMAIF